MRHSLPTPGPLFPPGLGLPTGARPAGPPHQAAPTATPAARLPDELWRQVGATLGAADLAALRGVNRRFAALALDPSLTLRRAVLLRQLRGQAAPAPGPAGPALAFARVCASLGQHLVRVGDAYATRDALAWMNELAGAARAPTALFDAPFRQLLARALAHVFRRSSRAYAGAERRLTTLLRDKTLRTLRDEGELPEACAQRQAEATAALSRDTWPMLLRVLVWKDYGRRTLDAYVQFLADEEAVQRKAVAALDSPRYAALLGDVMGHVGTLAQQLDLDHNQFLPLLHRACPAPQRARAQQLYAQLEGQGRIGSLVLAWCFDVPGAATPAFAYARRTCREHVLWATAFYLAGQLTAHDVAVACMDVAPRLRQVAATEARRVKRPLAGQLSPLRDEADAQLTATLNDGMAKSLLLFHLARFAAAQNATAVTAGRAAAALQRWFAKTEPDTLPQLLALAGGVPGFRGWLGDRLVHAGQAEHFAVLAALAPAAALPDALNRPLYVLARAALRAWRDLPA